MGLTDQFTKRRKILVALIIFSCCIPAYLFCQEEESDYFYSDTLSTQVDLFSVEEPMDITLKFDIKSYQKNKFEGEYLPVQLTYHVNDTLDINKKVRVKARGQFRRQHCTLPPFWLSIKKAKVGNKYLEGTSKMKIVTHCQAAKNYQQYVLKEYLTYKIYEEISPYSFRVRLIRMKYIDTGRKNKENTSWAFMIEPEGMMVERLDVISIKLDNLGLQYTDTLSTDIMSFFQYMIGNADYSITGRHNLKLIKFKDPLKPYPIPVAYDFDYSGLINASYAVPGENLGLTSVTQRYFLGACREDPQYIYAIDHIQSKKDGIFAKIDSFTYLDERSRKEMIKYLDQYFTTTGQPRFIEKQIRSTCR